MPCVPGAYVIEPGQYGPKLVLTGDWDDRLLAEVRRHAVVELEVNYARGFCGRDLEFLAKTPHLLRLVLIAYNINDITPIHNLHNLRAIDIGSREKTPIDFTQFPVLEDCGLEWRPKATSVFGCQRLKRLWINRYSGRETSAFSSLATLEQLYIATSPVSDLHGCAALHRLRDLGLYNLHELSSLAGIEALHSLNNLDMEVCRAITSIEQVAQLRNLEKLSLGNCGSIASLTPVAGLGRLRWVLFWGSTNVKDGNIAPVASLPALEKVAFQNRRHYSHRCEELPQCARNQA